jgi:uncharacterized protein
MMKIRISEIGPSGLEKELVLDDGWVREHLAEVLAKGRGGHARASVRLVISGDKVTLTGRLRGEFYVVCSRCLGPAPVSVDTSLLLVLEPEGAHPVSLAMAAGDDDEGEGVELSEDDLSVATYRGDEVDLTPFLREQLILAVPIAPLCRPDCWPEWFEGVVETEAEAAEKEKNRIDPRWAKLKKLKNQLH